MKNYGLCGKTLKHSYSKMIHASVGNDEYELMNLERDEFYEFMETRTFKGINVTIPYKKDAFMLCDIVSDEAKSIGSVNTVINKDGILYGFNTDFYGFMYMLERSKISLEDKNVLILGSGGTYLTAKAAATKMGAKSIVNVSRNGSVNYDNVYDLTNTQVIINTTPVGMYPDNGRCAVDIDRFGNLEAVVDVVYNPLKTELILKAQKKGLKCTGGISMLVYQAVKANELFFGRQLNEDEIEKVINKCVLENANIVLVGMPGCGKTSVGKKLAEYTNRTLFDTDEFVEKCGMPIPKIFEKYGEKAFRSKETEAVKMLCSMSGKIISTGGGAVLDPKNVDYIRQNAVIVYIMRDVEKLDTTSRPLSVGGVQGLKKMLDARDPVYKSCADIAVKTNENVDECARQILSLLPNAVENLFGKKD